MPSTATASRSSRPPTTRRSSRSSSATRPGSPRSPESAAGALRRWYLAARRDLPWRATRDPYAVWVSEVMLQQTTVAVGRMRFGAFLERFPSVEALAAASEEDVLAAWSGLGYYARARNLHRAAREIARRGGFPRSAAELSVLPGVGRYTAAAVASIAFGEPVAAVEANALRVLARLFGIRGDVRTARARARVEAAAERLLDRDHPGDHNQALMDLGASLCTPEGPSCGACPLARSCAARAAGRPERFGPRPRRTRTRAVTLAAGIALRGGRLVLREDGALVRGHLVPPLCEVAAGEEPARALARSWPAPVAATAPAGTIRHAVLERRYTVHVFLVRERRAGGRGLVLASREEIAGLPHGGLLRKILRLVDWPA